MNALAAGSTLCEGRYRLDAVVGRGGMSIVWRATDLQLERAVAIKVISDVLATDPNFVARFEREARLAAGLNHPNLVKIFDFSVEEERPLLVMEYIPGGTLTEARGQPLDAEALARELLDAVAHIHAAGILHRDIKPANVLLGIDGSPHLTDFGIARGEETTGLTQTGQVLGTLRYIAPEVAAGEPATTQSDLYSLGVLLGEIASADKSDALDRLIARMSARDPADRPATAMEALAELDPTRPLRYLVPQPEVEVPGTSRAVEAPGTSRGGRRFGPASRGFGLRRSQAVAAAALLVAVLIVVVVAASGGGKANRVLAPAPDTRLRAAPAGAPAGQQLDRLERIVETAPRRR